MLSPRATVLRNGQREVGAGRKPRARRSRSSEPGDKVPADIRLTRVKGLRVQEAAITGESVPVDKSIEPVSGCAAGRSRFYGLCRDARGGRTGLGIVVETGPSMEIGRISEMLTEVQELSTPLLRQMNVFARWLTVAIR